MRVLSLQLLCSRSGLASLHGPSHPALLRRLFLTHKRGTVTMESAAAMQPTSPGVARTQQSALVCATISPSLLGASRACGARGTSFSTYVCR